MAAQWSDLTIYVIRHAHRADKVPGYDGGWNTPISQTGHEQSKELAQFMAEKKLDCLYSSCHLRALETAEHVHRAVGGEWQVWPVFGEFSNQTQYLTKHRKLA